MLAKIQGIINKNSDVEALLEKIESETLGHSYIKSYKCIEDFFKVSLLDENSVVQGAHMVYGWMPTILNICKPDSDTQKVILSIEKLSENPNDVDLNIIKKFMNNSTVGASKLLHFKYPEKYPIWDSKICKIITGKSYHEKVQKTSKYINYYEAIHNLMNNLPENLVNFKKEFEKKFKYQISDVRAAELMLFIAADETFANNI